MTTLSDSAAGPPLPPPGPAPDAGTTPARPPLAMRALLPLFLGTLIGGMNGTVMFIVLPPIARDLGFPEWSVGILYSSAAIMATINAPFWGRRADRWGRKPVLLVGLFGYAIDMALLTIVLALALQGILGGVVVYIALVLLRVISGTFASATQPASQAYIVDVTDERSRTSGLALLAAMSGTATIIGPAVGALFGWISVLAPAALPAILGLGNGIWASLALKEPVSRKERAARPPVPNLSPFDRRIVVFLGVLVLGMLAQSALPSTLSFLVQDRLGLTGEQTTQQAGLILLMMGVSSLTIQLGIVRRYRPAPRLMVLIGLPVITATGIILGLANSLPVFLIGGFIAGGGFGFFMPGITAAATLAIPPTQQGALGGLTFSAITAAFAVGPLVGATLYGINPLVPYALVAILPMLALTLFLFRAPRPAAPASPSPTTAG